RFAAAGSTPRPARRRSTAPSRGRPPSARPPGTARSPGRKPTPRTPGRPRRPPSRRPASAGTLSGRSASCGAAPFHGRGNPPADELFELRRVGRDRGRQELGLPLLVLLVEPLVHRRRVL